MLKITSPLHIDERELLFEYIRASGPGGQNVNKVATAVQLRFNIADSPSLTSELKGRLIQLAGKRVNTDGILIIEAKRFRTQEQNREAAIQRFVDLIQRSMIKPKARVKTKPTNTSKEKRLQKKRHHGEVKKIRQNKTFE